jgi:hypothetical protein
LQQVGWFSLAILGVTGMFQMSSSPNYQGFLAVDNPWAMAILAKHVVIGGMVVAAAYMTWGVLPALQRLAILQAAGRPAAQGQSERLQKQERWILGFNLLLSVVVLLLTAVARVYAGG